ncbi:SDR family NAD(P)-dependent oxidoreductase [Paenibacillus rigui]|uniref:Short-chain dehydrogenase n=1 Tax=Paenibacillus rigui TaxID=554312 RepID=A0A229UX50_9BACL|nr:SDR family oxidoreductase [Paenibacillus rigui]OXM87499.1 short-chain dehydrogenase [Paenibacillus rigui]
MRLLHKTIFITDSDSPSGKALMQHLAGEGAHLLVNSTSGGVDIEAQRVYCLNAGSNLKVVRLDLCHSAEVMAMLDEAEQHIGPVDILIHNNNRVETANVETCAEDLFVQVMDDNAKSAFVCTQSVGSRMAKRRAGKIIFISSIHAEKPTGSSFMYSLSRSAVKMLSKEAALELGRYGIQVNTIELGPVEGDEDRFRSTLSTLYEDVQYKIPSTVMGTYNDLAEAILYLATDASRYVNGADLRLDGGFLLHYMNHKMNKPAST